MKRKFKATITITEITTKNPYHLNPGEHQFLKPGKRVTGFCVDFQGLRTGTGRYCKDRQDLLLELGFIISEFNNWNDFTIIDKR